MSSIFLKWFADSDPLLEQTHHKQISLAQAHFPVPPGFIVTSDAYFSFLRENNLDYKIKQLLSTISIEHADSLMQGENLIKRLFEKARLSDTFISELTDFYEKIGKNEVRLSLHEKESHGRKHASIHVISEHQLIKEIKYLWAEMFTGNAVWHRHHKNLNHLQTGAEIIVQKKVNEDTTGTVITIDPFTHEKDKLVIITKHPHAGDKYILSKKNLSILDRTLSYQSNVPKLSHDEILKIAAMAKKVENFLYFPQEITWAIDDTDLFIIETKAVTTLPQEQTLKKKRLPIARGKGITERIGTGTIIVIQNEKDLDKIASSNIVVISTIETTQIKELKKTKALIIESRSLPTQISIMLKQYGIPTIINIKHAKKQFKRGHTVTVNGEKGEIYLGGFL